MKSKRILSIILVFIMVFAMAATACGKKEEAAEKEEPKQEETSGADEAEVDDEADAEAADEEETADTGLTDEKIDELYSSIKTAVKREYLEVNDISPSDFQWPPYGGESDEPTISDDGYLWTYMVIVYDNYTMTGELYNTTDYPPGIPLPEKRGMMDAVLIGISEWHSENQDVKFYDLEKKIGDLPIAISENVKFDE